MKTTHKFETSNENGLRNTKCKLCDKTERHANHIGSDGAAVAALLELYKNGEAEAESAKITPVNFVYEVYHTGELAAGIRDYSDEITITVSSGVSGREAGEFALAMRESLAEWYDGATVVWMR